MFKKYKFLLIIELLLLLVCSCDNADKDFDLDENGNWLLSLFSNCICIGDSVTEGQVFDYPSTPPDGIVTKDNSYPAFLARMTGWTVENAGVSGISASQWWNNKFNEYDFSRYDIAIIELGYNEGLTETLDEDTGGRPDYHDFADTNTGNYCKIIEGILDQNPDIRIFLTISPMMKSNGKKSLSTCRTVILQIAEKYDLPVIDLTDTSYIDLNEDIYHGKDSDGKLNKIHFNILGYCAKAALIRHSITTILKKRPDLLP